MAGYKNAALAYGPKLFLTFDGDAFDPVTRMFTAAPATILDESGEENHAILHDSGAVSGYPGYRAGMPSLVSLEPGGQYATSFGYYGRRAAAPNIYEKAYLEVPSNALSFNFPNDGQYTVMFVMNRENVTQYRADTGFNSTLSRPITRKTGVFTMRIVYPFGGANYFEVTTPDGNTLTWNLPTDFHGVDRHIAMTWTAGPTGVDAIPTGVLRLYVDGQMVASRSQTYFDSLPNTNVNSAVYVAGYPEAGTNHSDRQTEGCSIDQFAIYDFAMSGNQVTRMYRKMLSYRDMIIRAKPSNYWECAESETVTTTTLVSTIGSITATLTGGAGKVSRGTPGPDQVPGTQAVSMTDGGQIFFRNGTSTASVFSIASDYSIEFWFKCTSTTIASLFAMTATQYPYAGLNVSINLANNNYQSGSIQVQESELETLSVSGNWNDGNFHHLAIVKEDDTIYVWIDGSLRGLRELTSRATGYPGTATLFGSAPGRLAAAGAVSEIAWYTRPLQEQEITARANYKRIYKIRGRVTLRGIPYRANVRLYSHVTGAMVQEIFSDPNDGEYLAELFDNRLIDMMVLNSQDPTIRYRVYGPVSPSEYEDAP